MTNPLPIVASGVSGAALPLGLNLSLDAAPPAEGAASETDFTIDLAGLLSRESEGELPLPEALADEQPADAEPFQPWVLLLVPELANLPAPVAELPVPHVTLWPVLLPADDASRPRMVNAADQEIGSILPRSNWQASIPASIKPLNIHMVPAKSPLDMPVATAAAPAPITPVLPANEPPAAVRDPVPARTTPDAEAQPPSAQPAPAPALAMKLPPPGHPVPDAPVARAPGSSAQNVAGTVENMVRPLPARIRPVPAGDLPVPDRVRPLPAVGPAILPPAIEPARAQIRAAADPVLPLEAAAPAPALPVSSPIPPSPTAAPPIAAMPPAEASPDHAADPSIAIASDRLGAVSVRLNGGAQDLQVAVQVQPAAAALIGAEGARLQQDLAAAGVALAGLSVNGQRADLSGGGSGRRGARPPRAVIDPIAGPARLNRSPARSIDRFA